jgi:hypothetical protein
VITVAGRRAEGKLQTGRVAACNWHALAGELDNYGFL